MPMYDSPAQTGRGSEGRGRSGSCPFRFRLEEVAAFINFVCIANAERRSGRATDAEMPGSLPRCEKQEGRITEGEDRTLLDKRHATW